MRAAKKVPFEQFATQQANSPAQGDRTVLVVPMALWGKDHWSTLAYLETRVVDQAGKPDLRHLRCDPRRHPGLGNGQDGGAYPTRLNDGTTREHHDDWDCIDDMVAEGLVVWEGTGVNPVFRLTDLGWQVAGQLRRHTAETRASGLFRWPIKNT